MSDSLTTSPTSVDAILQATRRVIAERGPEKFTMSAIAQAAQVSRPTLYRWFPSKSDLLEALTVYERQRFDEHLRWAIEAQPSRGRKLDAALRCLVTYLDGLMGPDPIGVDPEFAIQSLARSLTPQTDSLVALLGDALDTVPAVRRGHVTRSEAGELFLRLAYSHYLLPHGEPEVLLANMRSLAGLSQPTTTNADG